jgi:NAD(P)-dependent dehydrogenase (short-subunit alcohol dehydrogenase family)
LTQRAFDGRVDFLVNIADGSGPPGRPIRENALAECEQIMTLDVTGCFLTMRAVLPGITPDEARDRMASDYALKQISTDADVAGAVLFLLGPRARQITGQDIAVDGGWVI